MDERLDTPQRTPDETPNEDHLSARRDYQMDQIISYVLRGGVLLSAGLLIVGAALYAVSALRGEAPAATATYPHSLGDVVAGVAHGDPLAVLALGLLVLLLTPVARVAISIFAFARERDWLYVGITTLVLLILLASFLLGRGGA